jgi:hypothetical protein
LAWSAPLLIATAAPAQTTGSYSAPAEFMDLFFDFTGNGEPGYPAGQLVGAYRGDQLAHAVPEGGIRLHPAR